MGHASTTDRIAFVQACCHKDIVDQGRDAFAVEIERHGLGREQIEFFEVPGSLEIPLQAKLLAKTGRYAVIVAAGLIVNGGIYRHEFVAATVVDALMQVQLDTDIPIISLVLTPQNFHEHEAHQQFFHDHFKVKGTEATVAWVKTLQKPHNCGADAVVPDRVASVAGCLAGRMVPNSSDSWLFLLSLLKSTRGDAAPGPADN